MADVAVTNTLVTGAKILASQLNVNYADLVTFINNRNNALANWAAIGVTGNAAIGGTLGVTGNTSLTGTLAVTGVASFATGSAGSPSINLTADTDTGIRGNAANALYFVTGGTDRWVITGAGGLAPANGTELILIADGVVGTPALQFTNDANTGIYRPTTDTINVSCGGVDVASFITSAGTAIARFPDGIAAATGIGFINDGNTGFVRTGADAFGAYCGATAVLNFSATGCAVIGTNTNDNAAAGFVGEVVSSIDTSFGNVTGSGTWTDITTISLTAGDWDIYGQPIMNYNSVNFSGNTAGAISINTGNTTTDHVEGSNQMPIFYPLSTNTSSGCSIAYRLSLAGTTTIYLKAVATYSSGTPQIKGTIWARRRR